MMDRHISKAPQTIETKFDEEQFEKSLDFSKKNLIELEEYRNKLLS